MALAQTPSRKRRGATGLDWTREGEGTARQPTSVFTASRRARHQKRGRSSRDEVREIEASRAHVLQRRALLPLALSAAAASAATRGAAGGLPSSPFSLARSATVDRELWASAYVRHAPEAPSRAGGRSTSRSSLFVWNLLPRDGEAAGINAPLGSALIEPALAAEIKISIGADITSAAAPSAVSIGHAEDPRMGAPLVRIFRCGGGRGVFALLPNGCHFMRWEPDSALSLVGARPGADDAHRTSSTPFPSRAARWGTGRGRSVDRLTPLREAAGNQDEDPLADGEYFTAMCEVGRASEGDAAGSAADDAASAFRCVTSSNYGRFWLFMVQPRCEGKFFCLLCHRLTVHANPAHHLTRPPRTSLLNPTMVAAQTSRTSCGGCSFIYRYILNESC